LTLAFGHHEDRTGAAQMPEQFRGELLQCQRVTHPKWVKHPQADCEVQGEPDHWGSLPCYTRACCVLRIPSEAAPVARSSAAIPDRKAISDWVLEKEA
jgi:hypothetical protein